MQPWMGQVWVGPEVAHPGHQVMRNFWSEARLLSTKATTPQVTGWIPGVS